MWEPATDIEQRMREALRAGRREDYFRLLARLELLLPVSGDGVNAPGGPGSWATWSTQDRTHVLAFTSEAALRACLRIHAGPFRTVRFTALADSWPDEDWWLAVNPGLPIEGYLPSWFVAQVATGDTTLPEQDMPPAETDPAAAVPMDSPSWPQAAPEPARRESAESGWPSYPPEDRPASDGFARFDPPAEPPRYGERETVYPPEPSAFPAEPPAYPAGPSGFSAEPPGYAPEPPPPAAAPQGWPEPPRAPAEPPPLTTVVALSETEVEDRLAQAASSGDTETFLGVLMQGWAYLPVPEGVPESARPGDPGFHWYTDLIDGAYSATAFTTQVRLAARYGDRPYVRTTFARVAEHWPGLEYSLYVNPGTEVGANMPGPQVATLVTWARSKGLIEAAYEMEERAAGAERAPERAVVPKMMQKVVPHHQVPLILERGYDRVAGFVHHHEDVENLITPHQLYWALGLLREGGGFSSADESVHVLRWVGHRGDLYRQAVGGNDPEAAASRPGGWVVEPEPFRGDGFAPDPDGRRIPEYKVDSVRLPHGATMTRIHADGSSDEVAYFDADRREWVQVGRGESTAHAYRQEQQHA
ncbi:hypothetical protein LX16_4001 [Stackebrandtia albiflava]|uniref:SseB protein N-terminal domain-containing protein n=1 Tax=Stackebrandtia albiflava TaxID=406432 RepID=A0A562UY94_9ACTN|nr:hypothetical protein [Stackebrandtia albiflava]TWJ10582.1 hypothetical protein LX16_4001 [Stackebrandtia albiflava]